MEHAKDHCHCGQLVIGQQEAHSTPTQVYRTTRYYCPCGRSWSTVQRLDQWGDVLAASPHEPVTIHLARY